MRTLPRLRHGLSLLLLFFMCPGGRAELPAKGSVPPQSGAATLQELQQKLSAFVAEPRFQEALWSVQVVSLASGKTLFESGAGRRMSPASNCKLYTGALALVRLGGDYRIHTPLLATAAVDATGVLRGDLVVSGRGDPSWNRRRHAGEIAAALRPVLAAIAQSGVRRITGDIVADTTWLRCAPQGASWTADDLQEDFGAEISALSLLDNFTELRIGPGTAAGQPGQVEILTPFTGLIVDNRTTTVAAERSRHVRVQRLPGESRVQIYGELPLGAAPVVEDVSVPQPAAWFGRALLAALRDAGIAVEGRVRVVSWPDAPVTAPVVLGEVVSPPLREMVADFMKPSQNLETDLIFTHCGELTRQADTPGWVRSDELAVDDLQSFLKAYDLRPGDVKFDEGSGLSRNNLSTAAAFARLLAFMAQRPEAEAFAASLPVAGVDGSLDTRMKGTFAEKNVRAKTGGLRWVAALSGYVRSADDEPLVFSLILNRYVAPAGRKGSMELDEIASLLAASRVRP